MLISGITHHGWCDSLFFTLCTVLKVSACFRIFSLRLLAGVPLHDCATFCLSFCQMMDIWVVSTCELLNNPSVNICVQLFMRTYVYVSLGYISRNGIAGWYSKCLSIRRLSPKVPVPRYISISRYMRFQTGLFFFLSTLQLIVAALPS